MKMRTSNFALWLCALAGCAEPLTPVSYAEEYEEALCAWSSGCGVFPSRGQCRDALVWDSSGRFQYLAAAVEAGRVAFDAEAATACLDQVVDLACEQSLLEAVLFFTGPTAAPEVCGDVFVGQVRNYDPCLNSEECAGQNAVCGFSPMCGNDACCEGSCRDLGAPPEIGEACTGSCGDDAFCARDPMTNGFTVCTRRREAGVDCGDLFDSCAEGLYCEFDNDVGGATCRKLLAAGENCANGGVCADDLRCYNLGDGARQCQHLPIEGAACATNNYPQCARVDNYCDPSNHCAKLGGPGDRCPDYSCVPYAECDTDTLTCVARGDVGAPCGAAADYVQCLGHLQCGEDERCAVPEAESVCEVP